MNPFPDSTELLDKLLSHADKKRDPAQSPVFGVRTVQDVPYLTDNRKVHLTDIYYPAQHSGALPTILNIHGGAWIHGSKENSRCYCMYLASKGFAVVNINYTLAENNDLRTQVEDINCCMHWISRHAEKFSLDAQRLFLCGDSTGAHLALLSYLANASDTLRKIYKLEKADVTVKAFGLSSPVADLHLFTDSILPKRDLCQRLFGTQYRNSPYFYCSSIQDVLRTSTSLPPVWMLSSQEDFLAKTSMQLDHLLTRRNAEHTLRYYPKGEFHALPHAFNVLYPEYAESLAANNEMLDYFCARL